MPPFMPQYLYARGNTRACERHRRFQKAENLTSAERLKYRKPLLAKPGVRPLSAFSPDRARNPLDLEYVRCSNARNRGQRVIL